MNQSDRENLAEILRLQGVRRDLTGQGYLLKSGERSPFYLDIRHVLLSDARSAADIVRLLGEAIHPLKKFWGIAAVPMGGLLLLSPLQIFMERRYGYSMPGFYVRPGEAKNHGTRQRIEGASLSRVSGPGRSVLVLEDVVSSGRSVIEAVDHLDRAGVTTRYVACVIERDLGGRDALARRGIELVSLLGWEDLGLEK